MNLQQQFDQHLTRRPLLHKEGRYLLAVSGGMDSMVLLELMHQAGCSFEVAHANFQLRGEESDADEMLVQKICTQKNIACHIRRFNTESFMKDNKLGVQEAARFLRYNWMLELLHQHGLHQIITAHHQDDNIETVLMNFFKGTGWAGMAGMKEKDGGLEGKIIRPLLVFSKQDLERFAVTRQLHWREDASNVTSKYTRNFFRNEVLPLVKKKIPEVTSNLADNITRFSDLRELMEETISHKLKKMVVYKGEEQHVPILMLKKTKGMTTVLYNWINKAGFHAAQTMEAVRLMDAETGRYIESVSHRLIKNRQWLLLVPQPAEQASVILIEEGQTSVIFDGGQLSIARGEGPTDPGADAEVAYLNATEISFPLILRTWKNGDYFYPLGMSKKKKLSRFFIDQKLSIADKEKISVLESGKKIIWIVGHRIDNRFKLLPTTNRWIRFSLSSSK